MIYVARVLVSTPGRKWAAFKQTERDSLGPLNLDDERQVRFEGRLTKADLILCESGSIKVWHPSGAAVDVDGQLEYEFVTYEPKRNLIVISIFVGDEDTGAPIRFDNLFPNKRYGESENDHRAFLLVTAASPGKRANAWALAPTANDAHTTYGAVITAEYLARLMQATKL